MSAQKRAGQVNSLVTFADPLRSQFRAEACDLRWDDLDLPKRTITVRRLKGSTGSVHYLERDELAGLKRHNASKSPSRPTYSSMSAGSRLVAWASVE
jgi:integrase